MFTNVLSKPSKFNRFQSVIQNLFKEFDRNPIFVKINRFVYGGAVMVSANKTRVQGQRAGRLSRYSFLNFFVEISKLDKYFNICQKSTTFHKKLTFFEKKKQTNRKQS